VTPALVTRVIHETAAAITRRADEPSGADGPVADPLRRIDYHATEPAVIRWARLSLLALDPTVAERVARHDLFRQSLNDGLLLFEQLYLSPRGPLWAGFTGPLSVAVLVAQTAVSRVRDASARYAEPAERALDRLHQLEATIAQAMAEYAAEQNQTAWRRAVKTLRLAADELSVITGSVDWPGRSVLAAPDRVSVDVRTWLDDSVTLRWLWELAVHENGVWFGARKDRSTVQLRAERDRGGRLTFLASHGAQRVDRRLHLDEVANYLAHVEDGGATYMHVTNPIPAHVNSMTVKQLISIVARYRAGDPTVLLSADDKELLISRLARHADGAPAAAALIQFTSDNEQDRLWPSPTVREARLQIMRDKDAGPWLTRILTQRFVNKAAGHFDPQRLTALLESTHPLDFQTTPPPPAVTELLSLPLWEQALATRWLGQRLAAASPSEPWLRINGKSIDRTVLESTLDVMHREVLEHAPPKELVASVLIPPSPGQYRQLLAALAPAVPTRERRHQAKRQATHQSTPANGVPDASPTRSTARLCSSSSMRCIPTGKARPPGGPSSCTARCGNRTPWPITFAFRTSWTTRSTASSDGSSARPAWSSTAGSILSATCSSPEARSIGRCPPNRSEP
jgi:hypothetical protein